MDLSLLTLFSSDWIEFIKKYPHQSRSCITQIAVMKMLGTEVRMDGAASDTCWGSSIAYRNEEFAVAGPRNVRTHLGKLEFSARVFFYGKNRPSHTMGKIRDLGPGQRFFGRLPA